MQRIRTVKPELFKHEVLFDLEKETGLPIRLAFIGLFTCCDREGRFKWRVRELKSCILPYDENVDFSRVLDALATRGLLVKYVWQGETFGAIPTWAKHQFINNKEPVSILPDFNEVDLNQQVDASSTCDSRDVHASSTRGVKEGKGREGKGNNGNGHFPPAEGQFDPMILAHKVLEELNLSSHMCGIIPAIACAVTFVRNHEIPNSSDDAVVEFIVARAREQLAAGGSLDRFFFESQKWRKKKKSVEASNSGTESAVGVAEQIRKRKEEVAAQRAKTKIQ